MYITILKVFSSALINSSQHNNNNNNNDIIIIQYTTHPYAVYSSAYKHNSIILVD